MVNKASRSLGRQRTGSGLESVESSEICRSSMTEAPLSESEAVELARLLAALADPVRLRLFSLVASSSEVCSCELEGPLGKSQPTVSHHTKVLSEAGLILGDKRGRWVWWHANTERMSALRKALGG